VVAAFVSGIIGRTTLVCHKCCIIWAILSMHCGKVVLWQAAFLYLLRVTYRDTSSYLLLECCSNWERNTEMYSMNHATMTGCASIYGITHRSWSTRYVIVSLPTFLLFHVENKYGMIQTNGGRGNAILVMTYCHILN
jgi:hypothetical protein